jgi:hypothetical protein
MYMVNSIQSDMERNSFWVGSPWFLLLQIEVTEDGIAMMVPALRLAPCTVKELPH